MVRQVPAFVKLPGHPMGRVAVEGDDVGRAGLRRERSQVLFLQTDVPDRHEGHQRPITDEQGDTSDNQAAKLESAEGDPRKEVAERNPLQYAQQANPFGAVGESTVVKNSDEIKERAAPEYPFERGHLAGLFD